MPEIAVILGGHEHTPFAGRMGHGANAAAVPMDVRASRTGGDTECVNDLSGTLCVKAGMDAENVVVVVVEVVEDDSHATTMDLSAMVCLTTNGAPLASLQE